MTQEAMPVGSVCNLKCSYCYENPMREAGNMGGKYDVDLMIQSLDRANDDFIIFGGEPLLMDIDDMEKLFQFGYNKYKRNGVQTNGLLITSKHIELFKKYNVQVGLSIDGPPKCNTVRSTEQETERIMSNLRQLIDAKIPVGLIITIHRLNGESYFPEFKAWLKELDDLGINNARLHLLETHHYPKLAMTQERTSKVFLDLAKFEMRQLKTLRFDIFAEMLALLGRTKREISCVWRECDTYNTKAVQGVNGDGTSSNCGRANKDGINWTKSQSISPIRQLILYNTPQSDGGCQDCRFFLCCRGYCPGTALGTDWRNRTEHCGTIKTLYGYFEQVLLDNRIIPLSLDPNLKQLEATELARIQGKDTGYISHEDWTIVDGKKVYKVQVM